LVAAAVRLWTRTRSARSGSVTAEYCANQQTHNTSRGLRIANDQIPGAIPALGAHARQPQISILLPLQSIQVVATLSAIPVVVTVMKSGG